MSTLMRDFNPSIRSISKILAELPAEQPIPECSWPASSEACDLSKRKNLIASANVQQLAEKYEIRSLSPTREPRECTIGPEYYGFLKDANDRRTIMEALTELEPMVVNMTPKSRDTFLKDVEKTIQSDMQRRFGVTLSYVAYFSVALWMLSYHYQMHQSVSASFLIDSPLVLLILNLMMIVSSFYLQVAFMERVRSSTFVHLLPILILTGYVLWARILQDGHVTPGHKRTLVLSVIGTLILSFVLLYNFQGIYKDCVNVQLGRPGQIGRFSLVALLGLIVPSIVLLVSYFRL